MKRDESIKISIIMATYNAERTIEQAIYSVICQTYENIEFIIVDGASTDGTLEIIKKYGNKIKLISEPDDGLYDALNKGIKIATGDYIEIVGSDDALIDERIIEIIVKKIKECDYCDIISGKEWGVVESCNMQYILDNSHAKDCAAYNGGMVPHGAMFVKKEVFDHYTFDVDYKIASDYKFFLQCYYDKNILIEYIDDFILFFATEGLSSRNDKLIVEDQKIYEELGLPFAVEHDKVNGHARYQFKELLKKIGLFEPVKKVLEQFRCYNNKRNNWVRHCCSNPYCRWCKKNN